MRILHVITALGVGGAERMLLKLLGAGALSSCRQQVVAMLPGGAMAAAMRATGARVDELNFLGALPVVRGAVDLARLARNADPDIIQGWLYHGNLGAALARAVLPRRVPLVWGIRQSLASLAGENVFARIGITLNRMGSDLPDRLLFNSHTSLDQHRAMGFRMQRAAYLPNGFETDDYAPNPAARAAWRDRWGAAQDEVVFGMVARYHLSKDHAGFLEAARRVLEARPHARFVLAGSGVDPGTPTLADAVRGAGLADRVHLLGPQQEVAGLMAAFDVYVSSSSAIEAFSNSVGEAMSCGVPCVVTDIGDSPQVVAGTGRVVPARDPAALAAAMVAMVDLGPARRAELGAQARRRIVAEFSMESVAARYHALYEELAAAQRAGV